MKAREIIEYEMSDSWWTHGEKTAEDLINTPFAESAIKTAKEGTTHLIAHYRDKKTTNKKSKDDLITWEAANAAHSIMTEQGYDMGPDDDIEGSLYHQVIDLVAQHIKGDARVQHMDV